VLTRFNQCCAVPKLQLTVPDPTWQVITDLDPTLQLHLVMNLDPCLILVTDNFRIKPYLFKLFVKFSLDFCEKCERFRRKREILTIVHYNNKIVLITALLFQEGVRRPDSR